MTASPSTAPNQDQYFAHLGKPKRIWAIGAVHSQVKKLKNIHALLQDEFQVGDRIVYLGNYFGYGPDVIPTINELLRFRRQTLALPGMLPADIVFLRGQQEEMLQKIMQLQFAANPTQILNWAMKRGFDQTLKAYHFDPAQAVDAARDGALALTKWTNQLRQSVYQHQGHDKFLSHLQRAAYCHTPETGGLLFVHTGLDPAKSIKSQNDNFWWHSQGFEDIDAPYDRFNKVIRGFDPAGQGLTISDYSVSLDGNAGRPGGQLVAAGFAPDGTILQTLQSG